MEITNDYHHFKGERLNRCDWAERFVVQALLDSPLADEDRESSRVWELVHSSSCKAFMHVLAEKRGVSPELARIAGSLHDFYVIETGKYKNHAQLGASRVVEILTRHGGFSDSEIEIIREMIANHSDKHIYSDQSHVELCKDADVFDCSLYTGTEVYYLTRKPLPVCDEYFKRILKVRQELGMPVPDAYTCLSKEVSGEWVLLSESELNAHPNDYVTSAMVALWALSSAGVASDWPALMLYCDGARIAWYGPSSFVMKDHHDALASWDQILDALHDSERRVSEIEQFAAKGDIKNILCGARDVFQLTNACVTLGRQLRGRSASLLKDLTCDPSADSKISSLVRSRLLQEGEIAEALAKLRVPQRGLASRESGSSAADSVKAPDSTNGWDLGPAERKSIDQLARLHALEELRELSLERFMRTLRSVEHERGIDLLKRFPAEAFGGETCVSPGSADDPWLAVAWPRFRKHEFLVGEDAMERFDTLIDYFGHCERENADPHSVHGGISV